ncbi:MAG: aldo/keto reductase [Chitinophagaceae bacterium]|nr:aldo/keto reductase [Chitinophagaceae bacterium]MCA6480783.1 aldo/keto reductase [Chitinophagaceae bacterium]MCA6492458.1 aldo/keto reductase [Chitinophagaceae bacterium]MCA6513222.1 aldo/keto reductase [Chitinophagaceae bacterium]
MQYRKFGNTDLLVSEVGFGCWAIGGAASVGSIAIGWGETDDKVSQHALLTAKDAGINFFDTADFYGLGHAETLLGQTFGNSDQVLIASKVGQKSVNNERIEIDYSKQYIIEACEKSLQRLKRDTIDFHQLHVARLSHLHQGECIEAMQLLQQQGKIRYWGISLITFDPFPEADFMFDHSFGDGFQLVFNIINQRALPIILRAGEAGFGVIARMPLQFGLLTGKMSAASQFPPDDHRSRRLVPELIAATQEILHDKVMPLTEKYQTNLAGLALSFILSFPEVSVVIPGIRTPEQVAGNTAHLVKLEEADTQYLASLYKESWQPVMQLMEKIG